MDQRLIRYRLGKKIVWKDLEKIFSGSEEKENVLDISYTIGCYVALQICR